MPVQKQGRLAEILQQEYKSKGLFSGAASAGGKRIREMFDIRNYLFSGSGLGSLVGRKIFGKGYTATPSGDSTSAISKISSPAPMFSKESIDVLVSIKRDTRISAKNSVVLPSMARDMNLVRQNILKLVKLQGGTAATKADMFFKRAAERESTYESQFGSKPTLIQPQTAKEGEKTGFLGILSRLGPILGLAFKGALVAVGTVLTLMSDTLKSILGIISNIFEFIKNLNFPGRLPVPISPGSPGSRGGPGTSPQPRGGGPVPVPGQTPTPDSKGPSQPSRTPGKYGGGRGGSRGKISSRYGGGGAGSLTIQGQKALEEKVGRVLKSPRARSKLIEILAKRLGLTWAASLITGPAAPVAGIVLTLIGVGLAVWELSSILDEALSESSSPTNMNADQRNMANLIYDRFTEAGFSDVQARAAVANAWEESRLNPNAHNEKGEDSVGLFQMNRKGGLGVNEQTMQPYSVDQLKNPEFNIQLAINAAKKSKAFMGASSIEDATEAFVRDVERPKDKIGAIEKRTNVALAMQSSSLGSKLDTASVDGMYQREIARFNSSGQGPTIIQDNSTTNMASGQSGPVASTKNLDWDDLINLLVDPA